MAVCTYGQMRATAAPRNAYMATRCSSNTLQHRTVRACIPPLGYGEALRPLRGGVAVYTHTMREYSSGTHQGEGERAYGAY